MQLVKDISLKNALSKTVIEVERSFMTQIFDGIAEEVKKQEYVPPLFDDFTIKLKCDEAYKNKLLKECLNEMALENGQHSSDDNSEIIRRAQSELLDEELAEYFCVRYITATEFNVIWFSGNKKQSIMDCEWVIDSNSESKKTMARLGLVASYCQEYNNENSAQQLLNYHFMLVNVVMYYMQHYSAEIEYKVIKVEQKKTKAKPNANSNSIGKNVQKITLRSKRTKYALSAEKHQETVKTLRNYKIPCWNVRGYYQHYGKEKVLKYIPPRINYRQNAKDNKGQEPKPKTYIIK